MDLKKLSLSSDQFPNSSPIRRKVVSGLSLGVVVSLLVLSVILFNFSYNAPFLNPLFQGFNSISSNSTSLNINWRFPFSTSVSPSVNGRFNANVTAKNLHDHSLDKTLEANGTEIGLIGIFVNFSGKGLDLGGSHLSNLSSKVENNIVGYSGDEGNVGIDKKFDERIGNESFVGGPVGSVPDSSFVGGLVGSVPDSSSVVEESVITSAENSTRKGENVETPGNDRVTSLDKTNVTISSNGSKTVEVQKISLEKCDIFDGRWVRDDTKPYYPAGSCPFIDRDFDCHLNKRPDDGFVKWRWQPNHCDIPSLNATDLLERLRGKKLVFVGDSLNRNMWESLVCILRQSVRNKKRVYEISGKREFKKKGFYAFLFEDYNCTVDFVSSPFLVKESSYNGKNGSLETLRLDLMDRTTSMYQGADILVYNTGHWWTHEKTSKGEDYYQEGNVVYPRLKVLEAYRRALVTWAKWVDKNIDGKRTQVIFRGYSVTHFRGGFWNSGGQCHKETEPIFNDTHLAKYPSKMRALEYVIRDMKTPVIYLNISRLTDYRKDAHPSIYRMEYKSREEQIGAVHSQDCSHWCLPGVPDTWNELLYASLLKIGTGSWRKT